jgi:hypothetical protein
MGLVGLWIGLTIGLAFCSTCQLTIIFRLDWIAESNRAQALLQIENSRLRRDSGSIENRLDTGHIVDQHLGIAIDV